MKGVIFLSMLLAAALVALSARYPGLYHTALSLWLAGAAWTLRGIRAGVRRVRRRGD